MNHRPPAADPTGSRPTGTPLTTTRLVDRDGPEVNLTGRPGVGLTGAGTREWRVRGRSGDAFVAVIEELDHLVGPGEELRWAVIPRSDHSRPGTEVAYRSTAVAPRLVLDDGSVHGAELSDQYGVACTPEAQHGAKTLYCDQWNAQRVSLAGLAGRRLQRLELVLAVPPGCEGEVELTGHLCDVRVAAPPEPPTNVLDHVRTTRGSHSSPAFSRGNTLPQVARPHGAVFGLPCTRADSTSWPYAWHHHVGTDGRPRLAAISLSHIPSPWIGDRTVLQLLPTATAPTGAGPADWDDAASGFDHAAELDRPHRYRVPLDSGARVELTATTRCVLLRVELPSADGGLLLRSAAGPGELTVEADGTISGWVDDTRADHPPMFVHGRVDVPLIPVVGSGASLAVAFSPRDGSARAGSPGDGPAGDARRVVTVRLATSFVGVEAAAAHLAREAGPERGFEELVAEGAAEWQSWVSLLSLDGATPEQATGLYSSMARMFLYPNEAAEPVTDAEGVVRLVHAAPAETAYTGVPDTGEHRVVPGPLVVNNGFWDTYRTIWPALCLIDPDRAGLLLDGLLQHFRDQGWTSRWSAPGPVDCMTGTTNDLVLADAMVQGVRGFDRLEAYDSALRNATVPAPDPRVGRKGLERSIFTGWTDTDTEEGLAWTLDGAINDYALHQMAGVLLAELGADHPRAADLRAERRWFGARALGYRPMFDAGSGFFRGRRADGSWRTADADFDPREWGHDYTETQAWGTAFTVPHDGAGLARVHGSEQALGDRLVELLQVTETGLLAGSYGRPIHEMTEARDTRMGMLALSNQPAHHIPFMHAFTGAHHRTQDLVREALERLFVGNEIGQGFPGDEDNGEMSAWYLLGALGLYPLTPASGEWVLSAPLLPRAALRLRSGAVIEVVAPAASRENRYVQSVRLDGEPWQQITVPVARLAAGVRIEVELGPEPSDWAADSRPSSLSDDPTVGPLHDLTSPAEAAERAVSSVGEPGRVFDDSSATGDLALTAGDWVGYHLGGAAVPELYTVTVREPGEVVWQLEGSGDGETWTVLDRRREQFRWIAQTRVFALPVDVETTHVRLVAQNAFGLCQLQLLSAG